MRDYTKRETYNYVLPENLIAQTPLERRDFSKMLVFDGKGKRLARKLTLKVAGATFLTSIFMI